MSTAWTVRRAAQRPAERDDSIERVINRGSVISSLAERG